MNLRSIKYYLLSTFLAFSLAGCDDSVRSSIPDSPVYLELNMATAPYTSMKYSSNNFVYFETRNNLPVTYSVGYAGIIVGTGFEGAYYAFDMSCPFEVKRDVRVYPNELGQAVCEECGSIYDIGYGNGFPMSGKATEPLRKYRATLTNNYVIVNR